MDSDSDTVSVEDLGAAHHYRTEIPNLIDDMQLAPLTHRLYVHLKRTAGDGGVCIRGVRSMAKHCRMSLGSVVKARRDLEVHGLITVRAREKTDKSRARGGYHITINDIWAANMTHFAPGGPGRKKGADMPKFKDDGSPLPGFKKERTWAEKMRASADVRELAVEVSVAIGIEPTKGQLSYWAKSAAELAGVVGEDRALITEAAKEMRSRGLVMASPRSLITTCQRMRANKAPASGARGRVTVTEEKYE